MTCSVEWDYTWHCTVVYRIVHSSLQVLLLPPIIQRQLGTLKCVYQWFQVWTVVSFCSCDKLATCAGCKPAFGWRHLGLTPTTPASLSPGEVLIVNADPQHQSLPCVFFFHYVPVILCRTWVLISAEQIYQKWGAPLQKKKKTLQKRSKYTKFSQMVYNHELQQTHRTLWSFILCPDCGAHCWPEKCNQRVGDSDIQSATVLFK